MIIACLVIYASSIFPFATAILTLPHLAFPFRLSLYDTPGLPARSSCGKSLGSDELRLDSTIFGGDPDDAGVPVSPIYYYYDGVRCVEGDKSRASLFRFRDGLETTFNASLNELSGRILDTVSERTVVSAKGVRLGNGDRSRNRHEAGWWRTRGYDDNAVVEGPVNCGIHIVHDIVFIRTEVDADVGGYNAEIPLKGGVMHAIVSTDEGLCIYRGSTTAPNEYLPYDAYDPQETSANRPRFSGKERVGIIVGSTLATALLLYGLTYYCHIITKRKEREFDVDGEADGEGSTESEAFTEAQPEMEPATEKT